MIVYSFTGHLAHSSDETEDKEAKRGEVQMIPKGVKDPFPDFALGTLGHLI